MNRLFNFLRKYVVVVLIIAVIIFIGSLFARPTYNAIVYGDKVRVTFQSVPTDLVLKVNGQVVQDDTVTLTPGTYTITADKKGYTAYTKKLFLSEQDRERTVPISLRPISDEANDEAAKNSRLYSSNESLSSGQAYADGIAFRAKNPIVKKLPYSTLLYTIGYRADTSDPSGHSIIIEIDAPEGMRSDVVAQIKRWGYDPTKLNIKFRDYINPFEEIKYNYNEDPFFEN